MSVKTCCINCKHHKKFRGLSVCEFNKAKIRFPITVEIDCEGFEVNKTCLDCSLLDVEYFDEELESYCPQSGSDMKQDLTICELFKEVKE